MINSKKYTLEKFIAVNGKHPSIKEIEEMFEEIQKDAYNTAITDVILKSDYYIVEETIVYTIDSFKLKELKK